MEIDMSQVPTKIVTANSILRSKPFVRGFNEVKRGIALDPEAFRGYARDQWCYERGRQFGCLYNGPLKDGRNLIYDAQYAYHLASRSRAII
jgi:AAA+ superfamily predicted ATPase